MRTVLMTGFDAFGGQTVNPSARAVSLLDGFTVGEVEVVTRVIPTVFSRAADIVREEIERVRPDVVISVGQAALTHEIRVERVALNLDDASASDNEGNRPEDQPISPDGPIAYWSTIPVRAIVRAIERAGIPATVSCSAGTFVCNHAFYATCHYVHTRELPIRVGFIHVPLLPEQAVGRGPYSVPSMDVNTIAKALQIAVETVSR